MPVAQLAGNESSDESCKTFILQGEGHTLGNALRCVIANYPTRPPIKKKPNNSYVAKLVEPYCYCYYHLYEPEMGRYFKLAEKEKSLYQELDILKNRMAVIVSDVLDHPCDNDDVKMKTICQIDYSRQGLEVEKYIKMKPAYDSPVGNPIGPVTIKLGHAYRDPDKFHFLDNVSPFVGVPGTVSFSATPSLVDKWFAENTGSTEHQDSYERMATRLLKSTSQYKEPLPSSRRRIES